MGNNHRRKLLFSPLHHFEGLIRLALPHQFLRQLGEETAMGVTHADDRLVEIYIGMLFQSAVFELVHHVVIHAFSIDHTSARFRVERSNTTSQTFLHEVVTKVSVIIRPHSSGHVERTFPITMRNHFEHHHLALIDGAFAFEGDVHHIGDRVGGNHHARAAHRLLVHCHYDAVGGENLKVGVVAQNPILDDVLQLIRVVAEHLLQFLWAVLVVVEHLCQRVGLHGNGLVYARYVIDAFPADGQ